MPIVKFTQGDRLVSLWARLLDVTGNPVDLTDQTVAFTMIDAAGKKKLDSEGATILQSGTNPNFSQKGEVQYDWADGDTDTAGLFYGWFVRADSAGKRATHPVGKGLAIVFELDPDPDEVVP